MASQQQQPDRPKAGIEPSLDTGRRLDPFVHQARQRVGQGEGGAVLPPQRLPRAAGGRQLVRLWGLAGWPAGCCTLGRAGEGPLGSRLDVHESCTPQARAPPSPDYELHQQLQAQGNRQSCANRFDQHPQCLALAPAQHAAQSRRRRTRRPATPTAATHVGLARASISGVAGGSWGLGAAASQWRRSASERVGVWAGPCAALRATSKLRRCHAVPRDGGGCLAVLCRPSVPAGAACAAQPAHWQPTKFSIGLHSSMQHMHCHDRKGSSVECYGRRRCCRHRPFTHFERQACQLAAAGCRLGFNELLAQRLQHES